MHAEELNKHERLGGAAAERSKYCLSVRKVDDDSSVSLPCSLQYADSFAKFKWRAIADGPLPNSKSFVDSAVRSQQPNEIRCVHD